MKKYIVMLTLGLVLGAFADETPAFELINDAQGYSYLKINEDMNGFAFNSDFKSIGNSAKVGVYKYPDGLTGKDLQDYINSFDANEAMYKKSINHGLVVIGDVKAGDRIGFYLQRNNGDLIRKWDFVLDYHNKNYIEFDKNFSRSSKDEWMSFEDVQWSIVDVQPPVSGTPLPGSFAVLLIGGAMAGFKKLRRRA